VAVDDDVTFADPKEVGKWPAFVAQVAFIFADALAFIFQQASAFGYRLQGKAAGSVNVG
jgi:hypothetical protein